MVNTTFANLKKGLLQKSGNNYNPNDATRLTIAGGCINDALSIIQAQIKGHPFTQAIGKTVSTVTNQAYVNLAETNIVEVLDVYQQTTNSKLRWIPWSQYVNLVPNPNILGGVPEALYTATQALNVSGQNIWSLYLIPTPSSVLTMLYDLVINLRFSADDTTADAAFSPLPSVYDKWIYDEAKPFLYEIIDPKNNALIDRAYKMAETNRNLFKDAILSQADGYVQAGSAREQSPFIYKRVATTPPP